ncbi:hypothetical protein RRG08_067397 [Elysia crispata]|uniref:Uncharacterized protein n=1 Tax=Elysia crispata TaxID=231223 RepID=A0AAE0Y9I6_9GAST|nr:hypothetical protein RRG08_067397 [Elysia crispata]
MLEKTRLEENQSSDLTCNRSGWIYHCPGWRKHGSWKINQVISPETEAAGYITAQAGENTARGKSIK